MNNKIIKILIPVVAVAIVLESILLVSGLTKKTDTTDNIKQNQVNKVIQPTGVVKQNNNSVVDLSLKSDVNQMKVGKKYQVTLTFTPKKEIALNALELYVKFNKEMLTISDLVYDKNVPKPDFTKISDKQSVIVSTFLFQANEGVVFAKDKAINILTFNVTPKKSGVSSLEMGTGDSEGYSVTMFVDTATGKVLPYSSNKLEIKLVN